jgi:hypothetical protein
MYKYILTGSLSLFTLLSAQASTPFGQKVNCRDEVVAQKNIYQGLAICPVKIDYVFSGGILGDSTFTFETDLTQTFPPTTSSSAIILGVVSLPNGLTTTASCNADIPFSHTEDVLQEVCDYKPLAYLTIDNYSAGEVYVSARGADFDGTFTVRLKIDGVEQSSTSKVLEVFTGQYQMGQRVRVESVVTDNDGYTTTKVGWATLEDSGAINPF